MSPVLQLVLILVSGTACQVLAWRMKWPSILLLLCAGIILGPGLGWILPDLLLGKVLLPVIELAVAIILFEGGLSLKRTELGVVGPVVLRLISVVPLITWSLLGTASYFLLDLDLGTSALFGAIVVISGPTVVIPLLRLIRARGPVEPILRWEGILIDPIGVILAVLVAEICEAGFDSSAPWFIAVGIVLSLLTGVVFGWIGAQILRLTLGRHLLPDQFIVPLSLAVLLAMVMGANAVHVQSGLLTATVMGLVVANFKRPWVQILEDFIGHTQTMFIGALFIILAARMDPRYLLQFNANVIVFLLIAVLVVRPIAVTLATAGTTLGWREKVAISALAPRGIVSAALASSLGASLASSGVPGAENIVPYTFATIIGTVVIYGLISPILFKSLGLKQSASEGVLFVGGGKVALSMGKLLHEAGITVLFVDTNYTHVRRVRNANLPAHVGNILSDGVLEELGFEGLGNLVAFTPNDEANALAAAEFRQIFGGAHVFQVAPSSTDGFKAGGRILSAKALTFDTWDDLWNAGYRITVRELPKANVEATTEIPISTPSVDEEFLIGEIENGCLYIAAADGLRRPSKPERQIVFAKPTQPAGAGAQPPLR